MMNTYSLEDHFHKLPAGIKAGIAAAEKPIGSRNTSGAASASVYAPTNNGRPNPASVGPRPVSAGGHFQKMQPPVASRNTSGAGSKTPGG